MNAYRLRQILVSWLLIVTFATSILAQSPALASSVLSAKDRKEIFEYVWSTVNEKYYDPKMNGVDWKEVRNRYKDRIGALTSDEQFYQFLQSMVGELRDAHTRVRDPFRRRLFDQMETLTPGISIGEVEGQHVIVSVIGGSEAEKAGVRPGMVVRAIDRSPIEEKIAATRALVGNSSSDRATKILVYSSLLEGEENSVISLWVENSEDPTQLTEYKIPRKIYSTAVQVVSRKLESGIGYIRLNRWKAPAHEQFLRELKSLQDTSGLIIDLRGNGGGSPNEVVEIGNYFFPQSVSFGRFIRRSGRPAELIAPRVKSIIYTAPVVILVNESSGSGSELFSGVMQESGRATIVGRQSCGCLLAATRKKLKGGGELGISEFGYLTPQGRKLEGEGVMPDKIVSLTLADLRQRHDAALAEAERVLKSQIQTSIDNK